MCTDTWIETYAFDDGLAIQAFHFCVSVKLVEVAYTESKVSICKQFHSLCLFHSDIQCRNVFLNSSFLQKSSKSVSCFFQHLYVGYRFDSLVLGLKLGFVNYLGITYDDTAWVEVVILGFALTKELWREKEVELLNSFLGVF